MDYKISIIIPVYNTEQYLSRCLNSVINQTYKNIEIICVNDKSTDSSEKILNEYVKKDNRIILISLEQNSGVSNARNIALSKITGEYVCFLDSDDFLELTSCEKLYKNMLEHKSELACGGHIKVNKFNRKISPWIPNLDESTNPNKEIYSFTKHRNVTQKLFKVSIIKENNIHFEKDLNYMEDALFLVTYLKHCKLISSVKEALYNVQINPNSLCRNAQYSDRRKMDSTNASGKINDIINS